MDGLAELRLEPWRAGAAGILYAEDFDAPPDPPPPPPPPEPATPVPDEAALSAAREAGYRDGLAAAEAEQAALRDQLRLAALQSIADSLAGARQEAGAVARAHAEALAAALLAVLQAAIPATLRRHADLETTALLEALLPLLQSEPQIHVRVPPGGEAAARDAIAAIERQARDAPPPLTLTEDPALAVGDLVLNWHGGAARRDTQAIWRAIRDALAPLDLPDLRELPHGT